MLTISGILLYNKQAVEGQQRKHGILAQLGEHLPYKQRVTGSSHVGPIKCRRGGTGRRTGLKILRD